MVDTTMDALEWLRKQLIEADPDLLREMVKVFAEQVRVCLDQLLAERLQCVHRFLDHRAPPLRVPLNRSR